MAIIFPIPLYRFFSKSEHALAMVTKGEIFFNKISAFTELEDKNFRDETEKTHLFKEIYNSPDSNDSSYTVDHKHRRISDAWAFCATPSSASLAKKEFCVWIKDVNYLLNQIDKAVQIKFGQELPILFGPISYNSKDADVFSKVIHPPYFTKPEAKMGDLEFRIVILPPNNMKIQDILPMTLIIPNPSFIFEETLVVTPQIMVRNENLLK